MEMSGAEPDCHHYEQLRYNNIWYKVGDCVYIQSHGLSKPRVARWVKHLLLLSVRNWCYIVIELLTLVNMTPFTGLQDREAVGAEWNYFIFWPHLHPP